MSEPDPITFLIERKFPASVRAVIPPSIARPSFSNRTFAEIEKLSEEVRAYRAELMAMPEEELQALYKREQEKAAQEHIAAAQAREKALFFNAQTAKADFDHWSRAAHWSLEEAVALSFGKDPSKVQWRTISNYELVSPFPKRYAQRLDLARRAVPWRKLFDPVLPGIFIGWARDNEIEFPEELEALVRARGNFVGSWKTNFEALLEKCNALNAQLDELHESYAAVVSHRDEALARLADNQNSKASATSGSCGAREKESLLKLVIGLAIGGYGYNPKSVRNAKASEMADDLARAGVPLDSDTIRKWLKEAGELLPPETE